MKVNDIPSDFKEFSNITLSENERHAIRFHLRTHMREHPVAVRKNFLTQSKAFFESILRAPMLAAHPAFALCMLVLVIGLGTSFAAESSLPGEALYAFKTRVNEPIQGALAVTPAAQTEWNAELTFRRLQEAEELAATGNLTPVASAEIDSRLAVTMGNFDTSVKLLETKSSADAANAQSDLEATLNAHEVVLASLSGDKDDDTQRLANSVQTHTGKLNEKRTVFQSTLTATDSPEVKNAALARKKSAEKAIKDVKLLAASLADTEMASSSAMIVAEATHDLEVGERAAKEGRWGKAYSAFQDASSKVTETKNSLDTRSWLKKQFGVDASKNASSTVLKNSKKEKTESNGKKGKSSNATTSSTTKSRSD